MLNERDRRRQTFQEVYSRNSWGSDGQSKFFSGVGSGGPAAQVYVEQMAELLKSHAEVLGRPLKIVDLGCGDFRVGKALLERLPGFTYIGCDIVPELVAHNSAHHASESVSFQRIDGVVDPLPDGDVCLVRQVFQHLSNSHISAVLNRIQYSVVYVTEGHPLERLGPINPDKVAGASVRFDWHSGRGRGVELDQPPYSLQTQEVFRCSVPPNEVIITERVHLASGTSKRAMANSASGASVS